MSKRLFVSPFSRYLIASLMTALILGMGVFTGRLAKAQGQMGIVAVVNEDVISGFDMDQRLRVAMASARLPDNATVRQRLASQILRSLVDERLKLQEAKKFGLLVEDGEIAARLNTLAQENNTDLEGFRALLGKGGIALSTLEEQIRAELAWLKVVQARVRPTISLGEGEIDEALAAIQRDRGKPSYRLAEIFLAVDDAAEENQIRDTARRMLEQIKEGANFAALAREFSQASSAARGGDLGYVQLSQLDSRLREIVQDLNAGEIAGPIRGSNGYYLLVMGDRREAAPAAGEPIVTMKQYFIPLLNNAKRSDVDAAMQEAQTVAQTVTGCDALAARARERDPDGVVDLEPRPLSQMPEALRDIAANQPIGVAAAPIRISTGFSVVMVCGREQEGIAELREEVRRRLLAERIDRSAQSYLGQLRRKAFIDLK